MISINNFRTSVEQQFNEMNRLGAFEKDPTRIPHSLVLAARMRHRAKLISINERPWYRVDSPIAEIIHMVGSYFFESLSGGKLRK